MSKEFKIKTSKMAKTRNDTPQQSYVILVQDIDFNEIHVLLTFHNFNTILR